VEFSNIIRVYIYNYLTFEKQDSMGSLIRPKGRVKVLTPNTLSREVRVTKS